jgi:hypothetical protein
MATTILCITIRLVYVALLALLGPDGFLFSYANDVYMGRVPNLVAIAHSEAPILYAMVDLLLGWGPKKTKMVLPTDCKPDDLTLPQDSA